MSTGKTTLILGPMFSGKTTEMLSRLKIAIIGGKRVLVVKHAIDTRSALVASHDGVATNAVTTALLQKLAIPKEVELIGVDEGQFFGDLRAFCTAQNAAGRDVIVSALSGDRFCEPWESISATLPIASNVEFRHAVCVQCQQPAAFSRSVKSSNQKVLVGGKNLYVATCGACHSKALSEETMDAHRQALDKASSFICDAP